MTVIIVGTVVEVDIDFIRQFRHIKFEKIFFINFNTVIGECNGTLRKGDGMKEGWKEGRRLVS